MKRIIIEMEECGQDSTVKSKVLDLITELQKFLIEHGNVRVAALDVEGTFFDVEGLEAEDEPSVHCVLKLT